MDEPSTEYLRLREKVLWSHERGRYIFHLDADDIARARLYCYAYRSQTIGLFHRCREVAQQQLTAQNGLSDLWHTCLQLAICLQSLGAAGVPPDARAAIVHFYLYDHLAQQLLDVLGKLSERTGSASPAGSLEEALRRYFNKLQQSDGFWTSRDDPVDEHSRFQVPNLSVEIAPLVYLEHVSLNVARVGPDSVGRTVHRHRAGVEIHLGFSPLRGSTILGECQALVDEGYAMPIPAGVFHGFDNTSGREHWLPFIFGSRALSGWGIFFDVEPRPSPVALRTVPLESKPLGPSLYLERALEELAMNPTAKRRIFIPAERTASPGVGALELGATASRSEPVSFVPSEDQILSFRSGQATVRVGPAEGRIGPHDHVGAPKGLPVFICPDPGELVVWLDVCCLPA
jgi:hypothetical protein